MKTNVEATDEIHRRIEVEIPWEMVSQEMEQRYRELAGKARLPGFRPGKVPLAVLRQRYGKQVREEVLGRLIDDSFEAALIQNRIRAVSLPELQKGDFQEGRPYRYSATVEVQPEIAITTLDVSVESKPVEVTDDMVAQELTALQESKAVLVPVEEQRPARQGDTAIVDYTARHQGQPLEGGSATNHPLQLGSGKALPGFEQQVEGMEVGQVKTFELEFPAGWGPPRLAGQPVSFEVRLAALKRRELPQLDDEFAADLGLEGVETLEQLKEKLRRDLAERERERLDRESRRQLIDKLIEANPFPLPPSMVERRQERIASQMEMYFAEQGIDIYEKGLRRQQLKADMRERAEREVRAALLLQAIAEREKIDAGEKEIDQAIERMAAEANMEPSRARALYAEPEARGGLRARIIEDKVLDFLLKRLNIDGKEAAGETPAPGGEEDGQQPENGEKS
ncbi:MAG: trigger factor [Deltaproteobacteria bacterium]|nr:MAG: trigger factor [Deltaproteobacteria bacterium]